jgi:hypothetical protein
MLLAERMTPADRAKQPPTLLENHRQTDEERGSNPVDSKVTSYGSTHVDYLTARIARDRPDILGKLQVGEYPSVRAAALEAGTVKPRVSVPHQTNCQSGRSWNGNGRGDTGIEC